MQSNVANSLREETPHSGKYDFNIALRVAIKLHTFKPSNTIMVQISALVIIQISAFYNQCFLQGRSLLKRAITLYHYFDFPSTLQVPYLLYFHAPFILTHLAYGKIKGGNKWARNIFY